MSEATEVELVCRWVRTYGVTGCELLLRGNDSAGSLSCVEGGFASDDGLALGGAAS